MADVRDALANRLLELDVLIRERNKNVTEEETVEFVKSMRNPATVAKTKSDVKRAKDWLASTGDTRDLFEIPPEELNVILAKMFLGLRKHDGADYEPETLKSMQLSLKRHLEDNSYNQNITKDDAFKHSRDVLFSKRKALKQDGLGNKKNRSDPFTDEEINILKKKSLLGDGSPEAIINAMWFNNTIHFGLRGRQEHQSILWGDVELAETSTGRVFLAFTERATKTRNGAANDPRQFQPKMFAQPGDPFCPVKLYKVYASRRPEVMKDPQTRFYIGRNQNFMKNPNGPWFVNAPIGKNTLGAIAKVMSERAGLAGRHTNHSGRKTSITKLLGANLPPTEVAQLSGDKSLISLNGYHTVNLNKQMHMSTVVHTVSASGDSDASSTHANSKGAGEECGENEMSDSDLLSASQELEKTLEVIQNYEETNNHQQQVIHLPIVHNKDGSLTLAQKSNNGNKINPESMFKACTFNGAVNIVFN